MASLLGWLGRTASGIERQVNPFDNGATYKNATPGPNNLQRAQQTIQNANQQIQATPPKYGVLAQPNVSKSFQTAQSQGNNFNRLQAGAASFTAPFVNTAQLPYDTLRLGAGLISRPFNNGQALQNAAKATVGDATNSLGGFAFDPAKQGVGGLLQPLSIVRANQEAQRANTILGKAYAPFQGGANAAQVEAGQAKLGLLQQGINNTGISYTDTTRNNIAKAVPKIASGVANALTFGIDPSASLAEKALLGGVYQGAAGALNAGSQDNAKPGDIIKAGALPALQGIGIPLLQHGLNLAASKNLSPEVIAHENLLSTTPEYAQLQHQMEQSTKAINDINQTGGSKVALNQHIKNVQNIQDQMLQMRRDNLSTGGYTGNGSTGKGQLNLNEGAFSAKDRANLDKQIAAEQAKISIPTGAPIKPPETANLTQAQRQNLINNDALQQTKNKVEINPAIGNTKGAIAQATGITNELKSRLDRAASLASKLDSHDQALLSERADKNVPIKPNNPEAFAKASAAHSDAFDYSLAAQRAAGGTTLRFGGGNYHPLYLEATAAKMDALGIPQADRIQKGKFTGFQDTTRKYRGYTDAGKVGLKPLNSSPVEDIKMYNQKSAIPVRNATLQAALEKSNPGEVTATGMGVGPDGKPFRQAAGANLPFNVSENVDKNLNNFKKAYVPNSTAGQIALKSAEKVNAGAKRALWFGSLFHYGNEAESFVGSNLLHPVVAGKGVSRAIVSMASKEGWQGILDRARSNGVLDSARKMGVELPDNSRLNRVTSAFSLTQAEAALKSGIDPNSAEGIKAGRVINNIAGQKNAAVQGSNPTINRIVSAGAAAPKWTPSQLKLVVDAFTKPGIGRFTEGGGARNAIIGKRVLGAGIALGGSAALAGRLPTAKEAQQQAGLSLNNPVPNVQLNSKNSKGQGQVMNLPTDPAGLVAGLATNPGHFLQSRFSPAISFGTKVATNKNWNDQPLADPNKPNYVANLVKNAAVNSVLPIGVQNFTNLQKNPNNPSVAQGVIQEIGGRLKTNPNDPQVVANKNFFDNQSKFVGSLNKNETALFNTVNPAKKDSFGNIQYDPTVFNKAGTYNLLADNPAFTAKYQAYQQAQPSHDPLWDLSKQQLQSVLLSRGGKTYPAQTYTKAGASLAQATGTDQQWYKDLLAKEQTYFSGLPKSTTPSTPVDYGPQANPYVSQQLTAKNYKDPQVQQYFNARAAYDNQQRTTQGLTPIAAFGQVGQPGQLDNPAQLAITPKGSSYGTGAPKVKTASSTKISIGSTKVSKSPKALTSSFKVKGIKASALPKGVKVSKPKAFKPIVTRKLSVSKMPSNYSKKKLYV